MKALASVLVGIDYSDPSDNALREAARIATWDGADLIALNVLDERVLERARDEIELQREHVLGAAHRRLEQHVENVIGPGTGVRCEFVVGHPFREMVAMAEQVAADLIVLGSHGLVRDESHSVGALATRCIRKARPNVLLVRDWQEGPFQKICACIDFSKPARQAAGLALHIAQQDEAALDFLHVHQPVGALVADPGFLSGGMPVFSPEHDESVVRTIKESLAKLGEEVSAGYPHETHVFSHYSLRGGIIEYLNNSAPDLVVLNTRGHTTIRNLLIGAAAEKIIHEANCSTLVVKPDGFRYDLD